MAASSISSFVAVLLFTVAAVTPQHLTAQSARLPQGVKAHCDLAYVPEGHERQKLDLYLPEKAEGPLPLIIWVHGGAWQAGSKDGCPPLRAGYVERGYAVASLNYRLSGHAVFPAQIEDCKAAIRWLRAHAGEYKLNPDKFGVWGSSAGGHLVALLGSSGDMKEFDVKTNLDQSSRVQAVCDYYGPTDLIAFVTRPGYERHADATSPESKLLGGVVMENKDKAAKANPITFVDKSDPPFLIVHGDKDPTVPINQSELLFESLKKTGVSAHFHTIHGAGHGGPGFNGQDIEGMVAKFFDERLMDGSKAVEALATDSTAETTSSTTTTPSPDGMGPRRRITWEQIVRRFDKNQDGKIAREEFTGREPLFQRLDRNGDGALTSEEHEAAIKERQGTR